MPVNPYSRHLGLLKVLHNTLNDAEENINEAIEKIVQCMLILGGILFLGAILLTPTLWIALFGYELVSLYIIKRVLIKNFNIKQFRDAIEGETYSVEEVNEEMVMIWVNKCNVFIGRSEIISKVYPILTELYGVIVLVMACFLIA